MKIVWITKENIGRFGSRILPGIQRELEIAFAGEEPELSPWLALGAEEEGEVLGAIAARLEEPGELQLLSLYVDADMRRTGVGAFLLDSLLSLASGLIQSGEKEIPADYQEDSPEARVPEPPVIQVKCLYALPDPEREAFSAFLRASGFTDFCLEQPIYELKSSTLLKSVLFAGTADLTDPAGPLPDTLNVSSPLPESASWTLVPLSSLSPELLGNLRENLADLFLPGISFAGMEKGEEKLLLLADRISSETDRGSVYRVNGLLMDEGVPSRCALAALARSVRAISGLEQDRDFILQIQAGRVDALAFLDTLAGKDARKIWPAAAWMDVELTP